jgi:hypothetical protein
MKKRCRIIWIDTDFSIVVDASKLPNTKLIKDLRKIHPTVKDLINSFIKINR